MNEPDLLIEMNCRSRLPIAQQIEQIRAQELRSLNGFSQQELTCLHSARLLERIHLGLHNLPLTRSPQGTSADDAVALRLHEQDRSAAVDDALAWMFEDIQIGRVESIHPLNPLSVD